MTGTRSNDDDVTPLVAHPALGAEQYASDVIVRGAAPEPGEVTRQSETTTSPHGHLVVGATIGARAAQRPKLVQRTVLADDDPGAANADYQIISPIDRGGRGAVYLAKQMALNRVVAIKRIREDHRLDRAERERFIDEGLINAALEHPAIMPVHEVALDQFGAPILVMTRASGQAWNHSIDTLDEDANLDIFEQVCGALVFAHRRGVLHGDIKPHNIMVGDAGEVLVMDWGMASAVPDAIDSPASPLAERTAVSGTPSYMSPEAAQGRGGLIHHTNDVYMLGGILFRMLNGYPPHYGRDSAECLRAASRNRIEASKGTGELLDIALTAMRTEPQARQQTVTDLHAAVVAYRSHRVSRELAEQAATDLTQAQQSGSHRSYQRAVFGYEAALERWVGNQPAQRGLERALGAYATHALTAGDLDLAASLVANHPSLNALRLRIERALVEREGS